MLLSIENAVVMAGGDNGGEIFAARLMLFYKYCIKHCY